MFTAAVITFVAFFFLWIKLPKNIRRWATSHSFGTDVVLSLGVMFLLGLATATISGMIIAAYVGLFVSAALYLHKKLFTHEVREGKQWVKREGEWIARMKKRQEYYE